ncbi:MAG: DUF885 family protein [Myxococcota bacterium]|nr:DUF885 family protein [Myxococcota bacterium]
MRRILKWSGFVTVLVVGVLVVNLVWFKPFSIRLFYERVFVRLLLDNPELVSQIGILDGTLLDFHSDKLNDVSLAQREKALAGSKENLTTLRRYDREGLSASDQLSYDVLEWSLLDRVEGERFALHDYAIIQNRGAYLDLVDFLGRVHPIAVRRDAENYLMRLAAVETKLDQELAVAERQADAGIIPPRFIIAKTLGNLHNIRDTAATESLFVTSFRDRMTDVAEISEKDRSALVGRAIDLVERSVYPAYDRTIAFFDALAPRATDDAGVWNLPDGDAYYQYRIRSMTTTELTAEEIHQIGLSEVARIEAEMHEILAAEGYADAPLPELLRGLAGEERFLRPDTPEAKQEIVSEFQEIVDEISGGIRAAFNIVPAAPLEVRRIPAYREATAASHYNPASLDGSRPAIFFAKLAEIPPRFEMRTLAYHEGIPGHHFQVGIQTELGDIPNFRKIPAFTAFIEGWALYAERLAWEMGYQTDPFDDLGRLKAEQFRAVRLVVDTGLHFKRWTRQRALDYMRAHTGDENVSEIERYCVWPGQALAYKIGMLKIIELRGRARAALGDAFDLAAFHDVVIGNGSLPLAILEQQVDAYISRGVGSSGS